ncbi:MAG: glycosyltransferase [Proteobacteria bacterium]|nr:glycosyltransferase [Pseudomonadota bacterium]
MNERNTSTKDKYNSKNGLSSQALHEEELNAPPVRNRYVVAHVNQIWFAPSETFIYNYIVGLRAFHSICLSWERDNQNLFPFIENDMYLLGRRRYSPGWVFNSIYKRVRGIDYYLKNILELRKARIIHAHFGPHGVYAIQAKKRLHVPIITSFYGYDLSKRSIIKEWREGYTLLFEEGDLFLVEGPHMKSVLIGLGCKEDKIRIQRIALPLNKIKFVPRKPKKPGDKIMLVFSGRFVEKKGLVNALRALKILSSRTYSNYQFTIIGDGPLRPEIENFLDTNNMRKYVRITGFLPYDRYIEEMQGGDIFVHPSITAADGDSEGGAPTVILEAQAMGMPVVSTFHGDIPNIVVPGKSALLSEEEDYEKLAENIAILLEHQDAWEQMGNTGRRHIESFHDLKTEITALENIYFGLLDRK